MIRFIIILFAINLVNSFYSTIFVATKFSDLGFPSPTVMDIIIESLKSIIHPIRNFVLVICSFINFSEQTEQEINRKLKEEIHNRGLDE